MAVGQWFFTVRPEVKAKIDEQCRMMGISRSAMVSLLVCQACTKNVPYRIYQKIRRSVEKELMAAGKIGVDNQPKIS